MGPFGAAAQKECFIIFFFNSEFIFTVELHLFFKTTLLPILNKKILKFSIRIKQFIMKNNLRMKKNLHLSFPVLIFSEFKKK